MNHKNKLYAAKLRSSNLRPTKQRLEISQYLFDREKTFHFTVDDLGKVFNSKNFEYDFIKSILEKFESKNTRYFRFIKDFIKKGKNLNILSDAFSRSQMRSKIWLVDELAKINKNFRTAINNN